MWNTFSNYCRVKFLVCTRSAETSHWAGEKKNLRWEKCLTFSIVEACAYLKPSGRLWCDRSVTVSPAAKLQLRNAWSAGAPLGCALKNSGPICSCIIGVLDKTLENVSYDENLEEEVIKKLPDCWRAGRCFILQNEWRPACEDDEGGSCEAP